MKKFAGRRAVPGLKTRLAAGFLAAVLCAFSLTACASIQDQSAHGKTAEGRDFDYYFSSLEGKLTFNDIDAAYDFLGEAVAKFGQTGSQRRSKGLSGILNGPYPEMGENKVAAGYFIEAYGTDGANTIPEGSGAGEIANHLKNGIGSYLGFVVFYENRAVAITNLYIKDGYEYTNNDQLYYIEYDGNSYEVDYPVGWNMGRAFKYLREGK
jgi:hypothetical protein